MLWTLESGIREVLTDPRQGVKCLAVHSQKRADVGKAMAKKLYKSLGARCCKRQPGEITFIVVQGEDKQRFQEGQPVY